MHLVNELLLALGHLGCGTHSALVDVRGGVELPILIWISLFCLLVDLRGGGVSHIAGEVRDARPLALDGVTYTLRSTASRKRVFLVALQTEAEVLEVSALGGGHLLAGPRSEGGDRPSLTFPLVHGVVLLGVEGVHAVVVLEDPA